MKYTIEEIKGLLEGITQGEWETKENGGKGELVGITSPKSNWFIAEEVLKKDASFIAAAPTIIRDLLAELERYKRKHSEMGEGSGCPPDGDCGGDDWTCEKCWEKYWEEE